MMQELPSLVGASAAILAIADQIDSASRSDAKVLILGESGVGKEVVARRIHGLSARQHEPLLTINCAGVPDTLLESELFGHVRGSFTGAYRDRPGMLQTAHRGTVFLDEIGEMSARMQGLLLRFLETGEIHAVGGNTLDSRANVRVIAATNCNLLDAIAARTFREDLYYRLHVIQISVPPLRERPEDIPVLLEHFSTRFAHDHRVPVPQFTPEALESLLAYEWPGNVRELRNVVERMAVMYSGGAVRREHLPNEILRIAARPPIVGEPATRSMAEEIFAQMVDEGQSFWSAVHMPFMSRDLTRDDLRRIVTKGLERTSGSYKVLVELFNMKPDEYKRLLNFLRKHDCHLPFQRFRSVPLKAEPSASISRSKSHVA